MDYPEQDESAVQQTIENGNDIPGFTNTILDTINTPKEAAKAGDRKSVVQGKSVDLGGRRIIKKKKKKKKKKKEKKK